MTKKNVHAGILGRRGGKTKSVAKATAARGNGLLGGRPQAYTVHPQPGGVTMTSYDQTTKGQRMLSVLAPRPLMVLAEWLRTQRPGYAVESVGAGAIVLRKEPHDD